MKIIEENEKEFGAKFAGQKHCNYQAWIGNLEKEHDTCKNELD